MTTIFMCLTKPSVQCAVTLSCDELVLLFITLLDEQEYRQLRCGT